MAYENLNYLASAVESLATVAALVVGACWTYTRFIRQREKFAFIEFTVDMNFIGKQDGSWIVELIANLENKGKVKHSFVDLSFDLAALFKQDPLLSNEKFGGQAFFPHDIATRPWLPDGEYFIEPGTKVKYSYVARVPEDASFVMLHGHFSYMKESAWHTAERTLSVPTSLHMHH
jgi:hypothetical protein